MARTCARWRLHAHLGGSAPGVKRDSGSLVASRRPDSGAAYAAGTGRSMDLFGMACATDRRHCHWSGGKVRSRDPPCTSPLGAIASADVLWAIGFAGFHASMALNVVPPLCLFWAWWRLGPPAKGR